ncbi:hypothetical protein JCM3770_002021 [Rhodotorula araucariae]
MRSFSVAAILAAAGTALAQSSLVINTPTVLYQCQPYLLTWGGGSAPYYVRVLPGGQLSGAPLATLDEQPTTDTSFTWTVNIPQGTSITLTLTDSTGATASTAPVTIQPGSTTCLGVSSSAGLASSGSATAGQSTPSATSLIESSTGAASSSAASAASSVSSAASSSASAISSSVSSSSVAASSSAASVASSVSRTASGSAPSASASGKSGAGRVAAGSALALVAGAIALAA